MLTPGLNHMPAAHSKSFLASHYPSPLPMYDLQKTHTSCLNRPGKVMIHCVAGVCLHRRYIADTMAVGCHKSAVTPEELGIQTSPLLRNGTMSLS